MLCDMAVNGVPILFHISYGAPDLPVTSPKEKDSHQLKDEATEFFRIYSAKGKEQEVFQHFQFQYNKLKEDKFIFRFKW